MSKEQTGQLEPFRYNKSIERKIGKRTGAYVRRSNIPKDFDGLYNMNDYWETTTEKMSVATDDLDTSITSDIILDDTSDAGGKDSVASSPRSKGSFGISTRRRKLMQLSSQKGQGLFDDIMNGSQGTGFDVRDSSLIQPFSSIAKKGNGSAFSSASKGDFSLLSAVREHKSFISNGTYLTKTPTISMSPGEEETVRKQMDEFIENGNDNYSEYYSKLQGDTNMQNLRSALKKIQENDEEEFSILKSPRSEEVSPTRKKLDLTGFSFLESTNKKLPTGGRWSHREASPNYNDRPFTQMSGMKSKTSRIEERDIREEEDHSQSQPRGKKKVGMKNEPKEETKKNKENQQNKENNSSKGNQKGKAEEKATSSKDDKKNNTNRDENLASEEKKLKEALNIKPLSRDWRDTVSDALFNDRRQDKKAPIQETKASNFVTSRKQKEEPAQDNKKNTQTSKQEKSTVNNKSEDTSPSRKKKIEIPPKRGRRSKEEESSGNKGKSRSITNSSDKKNKSPTGNKGKKNSSPKSKHIPSSKSSDHSKNANTKKTDNYDIEPFDAQYDDYQGYDDYNQDYDEINYNKVSSRSSSKNASAEKEIQQKAYKRLKKSSPEKKDPKNKKSTKNDKKDIKKSKKDKKKKDEERIHIKVDKTERAASRKKSARDYEEKKEAPKRHNKRRKRDKFIETFEKIMGPNELHLIEKKVDTRTEYFAEGRYPKRHRVPKLCFWKNERPIYTNRGQGLEIVGVLIDEDFKLGYKIDGIEASGMKRRSSSEKKKEKASQKARSKSLKDENTKRIIRNMSDMDEELDDQRIEALEKMNFEYKLISEDADTITVFLKIKAGQEKEPQKNVAGAMQCTVIKCEDKKAEVVCGEKKYILSVNDKFIIPPKSIYSVKNKSKIKDLEISCHIVK